MPFYWGILYLQKVHQSVAPHYHHKINTPLGPRCLLDIEISLSGIYSVKGQIVNILGLQNIWSAFVAKAAIENT